MRYRALACDYDGTIASRGEVSPSTVAALERVRDSGRLLLLVTGRELDDLRNVFPRLDVFDRVVAENGAVLYRPASKEIKLLASPPPDAFVQTLRHREIAPLAVGRVIVSTWTPHETTVLETIRSLGLELQVIFNKGAVMVLPSGVNKRTGLDAALSELELSPRNVVAVGDGENDHALLGMVECGIAVANALPFLKERADHVTVNRAGDGVAELCDWLVETDLVELESTLTRHEIPVGVAEGGREVRVKPFGANVLVVGPPGSGKSTFAIGFAERLAEKGYQFCLVDSEGEYEDLQEAVSLGANKRPPTAEEVMQLLRRPNESASVNVLGLTGKQRAPFFAKLVSQLRRLRSRRSRPHWIIVDRAHEVLNDATEAVPAGDTLRNQGLMLVTASPADIPPGVLTTIDAVIALGPQPQEQIAAFARAVDEPVPATIPESQPIGEAVVWFREEGLAPERVVISPSRQSVRRHKRRHRLGTGGEDGAFYFRGPRNKLNLRAQNLEVFAQIASGVDDATWMHHLRRRDYSRWFRETVQDEGLAAEAEAVETAAGLAADESRKRIAAAIEKRHTVSPTG